MAITDSDLFLVADGSTNYKTTASSLATYVNTHSSAGGGFDPSLCPVGVVSVPVISTTGIEGSAVTITTEPQATLSSPSTYQWMRKPWFLNEGVIDLGASSEKDVVYILESPDSPIIYAAMHYRSGGGSTFDGTAVWTVYKSLNLGLSWSKCPGIDENEDGEINGIAVGPGGSLLIATQQAYKFGGSNTENRSTLYKYDSNTLQSVGTSTRYENVAYFPTTSQWVYVFGDRIFYSSNGTSWSQSVQLPGQLLRDVLWFPAANKFVAIGAGGFVSYSSSLTSGWSTATSVSIYNFQSATVSGGTLAAVGSGGLIAKTNDGINWTVATPVDSFNLGEITSDNGYFIATQAESGLIASHDGTTWFKAKSSGGTRGIFSTSFGLILGKYKSKIAFCQQSTDSRLTSFQEISGQTTNTYTCTASDVGSKVFCRVTTAGVTSDSNDTERIISSNKTRSVSTTLTFRVTVEDISESEKAYFIDYVQQPSLTIAPNFTYVFDLSHPSNSGFTFNFFDDEVKTTLIDYEHLELLDNMNTRESYFPGFNHQIIGRSTEAPGNPGAFVSIRVPSDAADWISQLGTIYYEANEAASYGGSITLVP